jgi:hypothetical protein
MNEPSWIAPACWVSHRSALARRSNVLTRSLVGRVAGDARRRRRVGADGRLPLDPSYQLTRSGFIEPATELRAQGDAAQLGEQLGTGDDLDAIVDPRLHDLVRRSAGGPDQGGDEDARIDDDADHAASRRSRREAFSSS